MMQHLHRWQVCGPRAALISACLVLTMVVASSAGAQDAPHWASTSEVIDCTSQCYIGHHAQGGTLTSSASNVNLCQSCHKVGEMAEDLAIASSDAAVPGTGGSSHAFDVAAVNALFGAELPLQTEMALRVMAGNVVCSTCHDPHDAEAVDGGTPRVGRAEKVVTDGGSGTLSSGGTFTGPAGLWYLVDITANGNESGARFRYSKDNGTSWFPTGCAPATLGPCLTASTSATPVDLDFGVQVSFAGGAGNAFKLGERWEFSAAYPFLRIPMDNVGTQMCGDCHRSRVMTAADVRSWDGSAKSHPVGGALPAASATYHNPPRDGNGAVQGSGGADAVTGNDLRLGAGDEVHCLSCHGVHNAHSNTLSGATP